MIPFIIGGVAMVAGRKLLDATIENRILEVIEEAKTEAIDEVCRTGIALIKQRSVEWTYEKIAQAMILFAPIGVHMMGFISIGTAGIVATGLYVLLLFGKAAEAIEHLRAIAGVVRREGLGLRKIVATRIYERVYVEAYKQAFGRSSGGITRVVLFFSKWCPESIAQKVARAVAEVAADVTPGRIFWGSVTSFFGVVFSGAAYVTFFYMAVYPYLWVFQ